MPGLADFFRQSWHVLEPTTPLDDNWHIDVVCDHLSAAVEDWIAVQEWRNRQQRQQSPLVTKLVGAATAVATAAANIAPDPVKAAVLKALGIQPPTAPAGIVLGDAAGEAEGDAPGEEEPDPEPLQRIRSLLINIPPGTAKSRIVSVCLPAWVWLKWPAFRWLFLSANPRVATRDSVYCRDLIESKWYQETFRPSWKLKDDQNGKTSFNNTAGGFRSAFGFGAKITGDRADAIVWDDPHDADEVFSDRLRTNVLERWDGAIGNRVNDLRCSLRIGVMQRLHEEDLSGHVLKKGAWEHLCLPMEWEGVAPCQCKSCARGHTSIGWSDPRALPGADPLLFPSRFTRAVLAEELERMRPAKYAGQMQQRPAPAGGEIFQLHWWRFWVPAGVSLAPPTFRLQDGTTHTALVEALPEEFEEQAQSWDMTFKETKDSDFVAGGVWGRTGTKKWLLDQVRKQMGFTATVNALLRLTEKWPLARRKLIEGKANGPAVISALSGRVAGMVEVEPEGGKVARANAVTPDIEGGDVYLPHPELHTVAGYKDYDWVHAFLAEFTAFPRGAKDDQVDQTTQLLKRWMTGRKKKTAPEPDVF